MKTEPPAGAATGSPIRLSVDAVIPVTGFEGSRLFRRGEPTPYRDISEVPPALQNFVAPAEPLETTAESDERFSNFSLTKKPAAGRKQEAPPRAAKLSTPPARPYRPPPGNIDDERRWLDW